MTIFQIEEAQREGARLVIGLGGVSGGGKTYTALQLAYGMANYNAKKVGFVCTENKRGRLYSNALVDPTTGEVQRFLIGDLTAPFSPQRYIEAIQAFEKAGVEVLVIDSVSHEYEGIGGLEDIAHQGNPKNPNWARAKGEHKSFMNALLQSPMHIIACMRAREKVKLVRDNQGKTQYEPQGVLPIQEKNFTFELTASLMMWNEGQSQEVLKCPSELRNILGRQNDYITAADGAALRAWVDGAKQLDPEVERSRSNLNLICEQGMAALVDAWKKLPKAIRTAINADGTCPDVFKKSAAAFDAQRTSPDQAGVDELNAELAGQQ
jgi:hypothetical protein